MNLPVMPPVKPMLAKLARTMPVGDDLVYEPKWDGFRCIVFRDGDDIELGSRNERPLDRYFPELLGPLQEQLPGRCVLDGEIVIATPEGLAFEALLQRIHPAASRVRLLAEQTPASYVAFDLLALGDGDLRERPFSERRSLLEEALADRRPPLHVTPATDDAEVATEWFNRFEGAGLDGVVAKRRGLPYRENERVMTKVKHERTADCVVAGFRWYRTSRTGAGGGDQEVGSLLLGLYDDAGNLHHVGVASGFSAARRRQLAEQVAPYRERALEGHPWESWAAPPADVAGRLPGGQSRWNAKRDMSWEPLRVELVAEVGFDHLQGDRFRHATQFVRWRPDREPASATYAQLEVVVPEELAAVFGA